MYAANKHIRCHFAYVVWREPLIKHTNSVPNTECSSRVSLVYTRCTRANNLHVKKIKYVINKDLYTYVELKGLFNIQCIML